MSGVLIGTAMVVVTLSATALGFGIACVVDGDQDAACALLVLAPVIAGFPLGVALAIFGAAGWGWLGRWGPEEGEEGKGEGQGTPDGVLLSPSPFDKPFDQAQESLRMDGGAPPRAPRSRPLDPSTLRLRSGQAALRTGSARDRLRQDEPDRRGARGLGQAEDKRGPGEEEISRSVLRQAQDERIQSEGAPHG